MTFSMLAARPARPLMAYSFPAETAPWPVGPATKLAVAVLAALVLSVLWSEPAAAQAINLNPIQTFLGSIVTALTGTLGKTIATLALVCVCIGWFMGYIEMRLAIYVLVAIVFVGSAATIVNSLWTA